jgi:hypothetical protein
VRRTRNRRAGLRGVTLVFATVVVASIPVASALGAFQSGHYVGHTSQSCRAREGCSPVGKAFAVSFTIAGSSVKNFKWSEDGNCPPTPPPNERYSLVANPVSGHISPNGRFTITKRFAGGTLSISGTVNGATASGTLNDQFANSGSVCRSGKVTWRATKS